MTERARTKRARWVAGGAPLLAALTLGTVSTALAQQAPVPYEFRNGVWLDAARGTAYLMAPGGAVEAIDLASGQPSWSQSAVQKPLAAGEGWLLTQTLESPDKLSMVMLGVTGAQPRELWKSALTLPEGVLANIDDAKYVLFNVQACDRGQDIGLVWTSDSLQKPLLVADGAPESTRVVGNALVSVASGQVRETPEAACAPRAEPTPAGRIPEPGTLTATGATVRYPSADGLHYLATRELAPARAGELPRYEWEVYSSTSGEQIAKLNQPELSAWFVVRDTLLIHDVPPTARLMDDQSGEIVGFNPPKLRAVALASGDEAWTREYRDTRFQGTLPPADAGR
jgi:hypothetical protein